MEQNDQPQKFKVPFVPMDALFNIEVSGFFLRRCQILLMTYGETLGADKFKELLDKAKSENPADSQSEETVFILIALIASMEKAAKGAGKIEEKEVTADEFFNYILPNGPEFTGS
jgi:hypothetical protein